MPATLRRVRDIPSRQRQPFRKRGSAVKACTVMCSQGRRGEGRRRPLSSMAYCEPSHCSATLPHRTRYEGCACRGRLRLRIISAGLYKFSTLRQAANLVCARRHHAAGPVMTPPTGDWKKAGGTKLNTGLLGIDARDFFAASPSRSFCRQLCGRGCRPHGGLS